MITLELKAVDTAKEVDDDNEDDKNQFDIAEGLRFQSSTVIEKGFSALSI